MKATIQTLLLLLLTAAAYSQYRLEKVLYSYPGKIGLEVFPYDKILFKGYDNSIFLYINSDKKPDRFTVQRVNLDNKKIIDSFALPPLPNLHITDIIPGDKFTIILASDEILYFRNNKELVKVETAKDLNFKHGLRLNDSLFLLYQLYDHHPNDGGSGLYLNIFNVRSERIERSALYKFPGVGIGAMNINWVTGDEQYIYAIAGLSGRVFRYDYQLKPVSEQEIPVFPDSIRSKNIRYETAIDSIIAQERIDLKEAFAQAKAYNDTARSGKRATVSSYVYTKDFLRNTIEEVRGHHSFIEKIYKLNDNEVLLTISRPGDSTKHRDVFLYNLKSNAVSERFSRWRCGQADKFDKVEDFFPVDLINDAIIAPYFYKNKVYSFSIHNVNIFRPGTAGEVEKIYHEQTLQQGYKWQLLQYGL